MRPLNHFDTLLVSEAMRPETNQKKKMINRNIEIIEDNGGGLTIQNTETKDAANFGHKSDQAAIESLKAVLEGDDMSGWDLSDPELYITDEEYQKHSSSGGYRTWDEEATREHLGA